MLPDDSFVFNGHSVRHLFDDHEVRLRHLLRQEALPASGGGRHLLYTCPACKRPWYKAGRSEYPRLTQEQLTFLGTIFHADIQALHCLPKALCPICSTVHLSGMFSIGAYPTLGGYHFLWESASPPRRELAAIVCRAEGVSLDALLRLSPDVLLEPRSRLAAVLAWLETCPLPETVRVYSQKHHPSLTFRNTASTGADERTSRWQGYAWEAFCSPLEGQVLVALALTPPSTDPASYLSLLLSWHAMARALKMVL